MHNNETLSTSENTNQVFRLACVTNVYIVTSRGVRTNHLNV